MTAYMHESGAVGARPVADCIGEEIAVMIQHLRETGSMDTALFFRVEIGQETWRVDATDDGERLPLGNQVLVR